MDAKLLDIISDIGRALAGESGREGRSRIVLRSAQALTHAEAALLFEVEGGELRPVVAQIGEVDVTTSSLSLPVIPLFRPEGGADTRAVPAFCVHHATSVNRVDISESAEFDFSAIRNFDRLYDFCSRSLLAVPIGDNERGVIAVLLLMNARHPKSSSDTAFSPDTQRLAETLAWQAAALGKDRLGEGASAAAVSVIKGPGISRRIDKHLLVQRLTLAPVPPLAAEAIAGEVFAQIVSDRRNQVGESELEASVCAAIDRRFHVRLSDRFRAWAAFRRSGLPLQVLISGCSGSGKSTLAAELGLRLDIGRIHSTDTLREVMRLLVSEHLAPELHRSTYQAWQVLPRLPACLGEEDRVIEGFRAQADKVAVAVRGVVQRSIAERESAIVEGAHLHPVLQREFDNPEAVAVPIVLAVPNQEELKRHFQWRLVQAPTRSGLRHLEHFDDTWRIQRHLIDEAASHGVPVIANVSMDFCIRQVLELISLALLEQFSGA